MLLPPTEKPARLPVEGPAGPFRDRLFVGTSGWAYPTWKPGFYPAGTSAKKFLPFYAAQLNSVEVNYSFRTLPKLKLLQDWLAQAGPGLRFSFKAPQAITHFKRLRDCEQPLEDLVAALQPVAAAGQLGLILFQLPPNFKANADLLNSFLASPALASGAPPLAFEFRHESWFDEAVYGVLRRHNAALCIAQTDDLETPEVHTASTHTAYRLRRAGGYAPEEVAAFARKFNTLSADRDVYAYFRHEDEPTGALNAVALLAAADKAKSTEGSFT